jgi:hypothetical protein
LGLQAWHEFFAFRTAFTHKKIRLFLTDETRRGSVKLNESPNADEKVSEINGSATVLAERKGSK